MFPFRRTVTARAWPSAPRLYSFSALSSLVLRLLLLLHLSTQTLRSGCADRFLICAILMAHGEARCMRELAYRLLRIPLIFTSFTYALREPGSANLF